MMNCLKGFKTIVEVTKKRIREQIEKNKIKITEEHVVEEKRKQMEGRIILTKIKSPNISIALQELISNFLTKSLLHSIGFTLV